MQENKSIPIFPFPLIFDRWPERLMKRKENGHETKHKAAESQENGKTIVRGNEGDEGYGVLYVQLPSVCSARSRTKMRAFNLRPLFWKAFLLTRAGSILEGKILLIADC
jgi:hypothetical protein